MGSEIQVENDQAIEKMIQSAKDGYGKARTYYEARKEALEKLIVKIIGYLDKYKERLKEAEKALERCREEIARTESELVYARQARLTTDDDKDGGVKSDLAEARIAALERQLAELHAQEKHLIEVCEYLRQLVQQCEEQLERAKALKADWEDRGREALERTRICSEQQVDFGTRQLAAIHRRPSGR